MNQSKQIPIDIIALRANDRTHDGKNIIISLKPRYSPEQTYSVPVECLYELITDLQNLNSSKGTAAIKPLEQSISAPQPAKDLSRINVTIPKKWMLKSGLPDHPIVVVIFNPQTEIQSGYALPAAAAKEMGVGQLSASPHCTRCDNDRFFSHRAGDKGRQVAVIVSAAGKE